MVTGVNVCASMRPPAEELLQPRGVDSPQLERGSMAQDPLPGEDSEALERRLRRVDIALAIAAGILSLSLFYLAIFPG